MTYEFPTRPAVRGGHKQELFTRIAEHLLAQNGKSKRNGRCAYRGDRGDMCAIGCLVPDEHYRAEMEGGSVFAGAVQAALQASGVSTDPNTLYMLEDLQDCHDDMAVGSWARELKRIAKRHGLEYP